MTGVFALAVAAGGSITEAACLSNIAGPLRSDKPRNVALDGLGLPERDSNRWVTF